MFCAIYYLRRILYNSSQPDALVPFLCDGGRFFLLRTTNRPLPHFEPNRLNFEQKRECVRKEGKKRRKKQRKKEFSKIEVFPERLFPLSFSTTLYFLGQKSDLDRDSLFSDHHSLPTFVDLIVDQIYLAPDPSDIAFLFSSRRRGRYGPQ